MMTVLGWRASARTNDRSALYPRPRGPRAPAPGDVAVRRGGGRGPRRGGAAGAGAGPQPRRGRLCDRGRDARRRPGALRRSSRALADRHPPARLSPGRGVAAPRQRRDLDRLCRARAAAGGLAGGLRHAPPADRRPRGDGAVAARPVRGLRRAALPAQRPALRAALAHGRGAHRPHDAASARRGARGARSPRRRPQRGHGDGDRRRPPVGGDDHAVQPRRRAHARLQRAGGRRRRVARAVPRPRRDRAARRGARRRTGPRGLRHRPAARGRGDQAVDVRVQGRPPAAGLDDRHRPARRGRARSRASSAWPPT